MLPSIFFQQNIRWLGEEAIKRYLKSRPDRQQKNVSYKAYEVRKTTGGGLLDPDDLIKSVLDDNDFVSVGRYLSHIRFFHSYHAVMCRSAPLYFSRHLYRMHMAYYIFWALAFVDDIVFPDVFPLSHLHHNL